MNVSYQVLYRNELGQNIRLTRNTFAEAAGAASGLSDRVKLIYINAELYSDDRAYRHSGTLYKFRGGNRVAVNTAMIKLIKELGV